MLDSKNLFRKYVSDICPDVTEIYAIGYSQGAIFARQAIAEVFEASPSKPRGLLLLADPLFRYRTEQCCFHYTYAINHVWDDNNADGIGYVKIPEESLLRRKSLAGILQLPQLEVLSKSFNVLTVCVNDDIVCDFGFLNSTRIHSNSYKSPASSLAIIKLRVSAIVVDSPEDSVLVDNGVFDIEGKKKVDVENGVLFPCAKHKNGRVWIRFWFTYQNGKTETSYHTSIPGASGVMIYGHDENGDVLPRVIWLDIAQDPVIAYCMYDRFEQGA